MVSPQGLVALEKLIRNGRLGPLDDGFQLVQASARELLELGLVRRLAFTTKDVGHYMVTKTGIQAHARAKAPQEPPSKASQPDKHWPFPIRIL